MRVIARPVFSWDSRFGGVTSLEQVELPSGEVLWAWLKTLVSRLRQLVIRSSRRG